MVRDGAIAPPHHEGTFFARSEAFLVARRQIGRICFTLRRRCGRGLRSGTSLERNAPESLTPAKPDTFTATSRAEALRTTLDQVCECSTSGGLGVKSLKAGVESEVGKSQGGFRYLVVPANAGTHNRRRSLVGACGNSESLNLQGRGVWVPAFAGTTAERRPKLQFVFATLGGIAVVTNDVASSIASPNGVGIVMRNGTKTRVPAIGTKAISIRRSVARYLITGRSGM
ncbi:hypothetical protein ACVWVY_000849 [Bradyrhizobium sp. URHC0002]